MPVIHMRLLLAVQNGESWVNLGKRKAIFEICCHSFDVITSLMRGLCVGVLP